MSVTKITETLIGNHNFYVRCVEHLIDSNHIITVSLVTQSGWFEADIFPVREVNEEGGLQTKLIKDLDFLETEAFRSVGRVRLYPKKARLFSAGQASQGLTVLMEGRAKLSVATLHGRSAIVRIAEPGEALGLSALIQEQPYDATAWTLEPSQVFHIDRTSFFRLLKTREEIPLWVIRQLSLEVRRAYRHMVPSSAATSTRVKLAGFLLELAGNEGLPTAEGLSFHLGFTHEEISGIIGSSRETVSRLLGEFRRKDLIQTEGALVNLPDPKRLRELLK